MTQVVNLIGQRFGRLVVVSRAENNKYQKTRWLCKCDCGTEKVVLAHDLRLGTAKSCGCYRKERTTTHGLSNTRLYQIYHGMKRRCYNPKDDHYSDYGGRGITMCQEWEYSFEAFYSWALANGYAENLSIDRIDVNGNYSPDNCRWLDQLGQANNQRKNRMLTVEGETHTISEWARIKGISPDTIWARLKYGWAEKETVVTPVKRREKG